jgi:hypothetical protein
MCLGATRTTRSPRAIRNRSSAPEHVPAVLDRPHPFAIERSRPHEQPAEAAVARRRGQLAACARRERVDGGARVRPLVRVRPDHDHVDRPFD